MRLKPLIFVTMIIAVTIFINGYLFSEKKDARVYKIATVTKPATGKAIDFSFQMDGKTVTFAELTKDKVVFLNFWATWCGPCKMEIPDIIEINKELSGNNFIVIGIPLERDPDNAIAGVQKYAEAKGMNYLNICDTKHALATAYGGISGIPTTFFIDKNGNVSEKIVGMQSKAAFLQAIERAKKK
ncbi:MAG: alkyl hydroperoxide reductase/Thiol specific antioxidant/Mal allergen [Ignavibacteria bacterium]|nr:alkyl hydroperoxide reductase/Thiol specific antioxidant/Mal allergen [Ignavibacteria bacterium]